MENAGRQERVIFTKARYLKMTDANTCEHSFGCCGYTGDYCRKCGLSYVLFGDNPQGRFVRIGGFGYPTGTWVLLDSKKPTINEGEE